MTTPPPHTHTHASNYIPIDCLQGTLTQGDANVLENRPLLFSAFMSAALRLVSLLLYQTAIQLAPLSVTIPYLSFTPAMLVVTAFLMIGEQPSAPGFLGVLVVTVGGYLLAFSSSRSPAKKYDDRGSESGDGSGTKVHSPVMGEMGDATLGLEMSSQLLVGSHSTARKGWYSALVRSSSTCVPARQKRAARCPCNRPVQTGAARSLQQVGDSKGSFLMLLVAFLWSLTSAFDKMGMAAAPTLTTYLALQRACTAAPCAVYLILKDVSSFRFAHSPLSDPPEVC